MEIVLRGASTTENSAGTRVKIVERFYNATIYPNNNCPVTVVTFEPKEGGDRDITRLITVACSGTGAGKVRDADVYLPQRYEELRKELTACVDYLRIPELVNGLEFVNRYPDDEIVFLYLWYAHEVAVQALCADQTSTFPVSRLWTDWMFNPKTKSWHFDIASASIREWEEDKFLLNPIPLPQGSQPQLTADNIVTYFEKTFGDFLYLYASWGGTLRQNLSGYASHGVLTFGAVVRWGGGIVAHFPSTPSPELYFASQSRNITASYSTEVSSRVDMQIHNIHGARLNLYFSLRLPLKERNRLRAAYLSQHPSDADILTCQSVEKYLSQTSFKGAASTVSNNELVHMVEGYGRNQLFKSIAVHDALHLSRETFVDHGKYWGIRRAALRIIVVYPEIVMDGDSVERYKCRKNGVRNYLVLLQVLGPVEAELK
ncbi:hypothetical protein PQX77_015373, partial [Marasmius sp. AFHP31]